MAEQAVRKPVLVFVSNDDPEVCQYVESAIGRIADVSCFKIVSEEDATQSRLMSDTNNRGVIIMREEFARGFDIKFASDAFVCIFNEKHKFKASMIKQMVGRANRSQGIQNGRVFVTSNVVYKKEVGMDYFTRAEKKPGVDMGPQIAGAILKLWTLINEEEKSQLINFFGGQKYMVVRSVYARQGINKHLKAKMENAF